MLLELARRARAAGASYRVHSPPDNLRKLAALYGVDELLFAPLGMTSAVLEADASGRSVCSSYLWATPRDWARFGQFALDDGEVDGLAGLEVTVAWAKATGEFDAGWGGFGGLLFLLRGILLCGFTIAAIARLGAFVAAIAWRRWETL